MNSTVPRSSLPSKDYENHWPEILLLGILKDANKCTYVIKFCDHLIKKSHSRSKSWKLCAFIFQNPSSFHPKIGVGFFTF